MPQSHSRQRPSQLVQPAFASGSPCWPPFGEVTAPTQRVTREAPRRAIRSLSPDLRMAREDMEDVGYHRLHLPIRFSKLSSVSKSSPNHSDRAYARSHTSRVASKRNALSAVSCEGRGPRRANWQLASASWPTPIHLAPL